MPIFMLVVIAIAVVGGAAAMFMAWRSKDRIPATDVRAMHGNSEPGPCDCGVEVSEARWVAGWCEECQHEHATMESTAFGDALPTFTKGDCWVPGCMHESATRVELRKVMGK